MLYYARKKNVYTKIQKAKYVDFIKYMDEKLQSYFVCVDNAKWP